MNDINAASEKLLSAFACCRGFLETFPANRKFFLTRDFWSDNILIGTVFWGEDKPDPSGANVIRISSYTVDPTKKDSICAKGSTRMNPQLCSLKREVYEILEDCNYIP